MLLIAHRRRDRLGHGDLPVTLLPTQRLDRGTEHPAYGAVGGGGGRGVGHLRTLAAAADSADQATPRLCTT
ncbi:hypothetical protein NPS01_12930 [Nocardioides psychrotolerans]|nr:hypothetical protein NPS01_12930 [Nocardioides psychrotolerans]